jgi:aromatic-L-amino-acid decarboxylase
MGFDFDREQRRRLGYQLIDGINDYFSSLSGLAVQRPLAERTARDLDDALPENAGDPASVLRQTMDELVANGFHVPSANYFGLMNPTPTYMAVLSEALVAALNPQLASQARSQFASRIERETVRWIADRVALGSQNKFEGTFTNGGNEANFSALCIALHHKFPAVKQDGLASLNARPTFYCSAEAHHSLEKSVILMGLGQKSLRRIPVTSNLQMDVAALAAQIAADEAAGFTPVAVVATAGTTSSGAIDPLAEIAEICEQRGLWLHVDGAYGGALVLSHHYRHLLDGIARADSVTIDPHKWLAMPFSCGMVLTRHAAALEQTFGVETAYMPRMESAARPGEAPPPTDYFRISTQWSRRMNSLKLWMTLKAHGRAGYEELFSRQMQLAKLLEAELRASGHFTITSPGTLPIVNVVLPGPEEMRADVHRAFVAAMTESGERWISTTRVQGRSVVRLMIISYLTEEKHVRELARQMDEVAAAVLQQAGAAV